MTFVTDQFWTRLGILARRWCSAALRGDEKDMERTDTEIAGLCPSKGSQRWADLLKDPRWQRMRLRIMDRDGWACQDCGDGTKTLNVHHLFYIPKMPPWDYPGYALITLCETCHGKWPHGRWILDE